MNESQDYRQQEAKLQDLISAVLNGDANESEMKQLADLLEQAPSRLPQYVDHLILHELLSDELSVIPLSQALPIVASQLDNHASKTSRGWLGDYWQANNTAASLLLMACCIVTLIITLSIDWDRTQISPIAQVVETTAKGLDQANVGAEITSGSFSLPDGEIATLLFASGAKVRCEGPCKLDLESSMLASLVYGKVTADIPERAIGFTILTDKVQVTDLGTKFGVEVSKDKHVEVIVFDGEVNLRDRNGNRELPRGLLAGEAIRLGESKQVERVVSVRRDPSSSMWSSDWLETPALQRSLFLDVTDNLPAGKTSQFYEVVAKGLTEDTKAYSDRIHEWNSLGEEGFPEWLRGSDLVRRFNSRKYEHASQLELSVTVATDVALFVIWDNRCEPMPWLSDGFADTGVDIGMDEGLYEYKGGINRERLAVGGGQSIDTYYSVWVRRVAANEKVPLGPLGSPELNDQKNLYGIAAKSLDMIDPNSPIMQIGN